MGSKFSKFIAMVMVLSLVMMAGAFLIYLLDDAANEGFELVLAGFLALGGLSWLIFRGPVGKAMAHMLEGGAGADPMLAAQVADLEDRLSEISLETQRLMEIEDRLDFTERLLAQHTDPAVLKDRERDR